MNTPLSPPATPLTVQLVAICHVQHTKAAQYHLLGPWLTRWHLQHTVNTSAYQQQPETGAAGFSQHTASAVLTHNVSHHPATQSHHPKQSKHSRNSTQLHGRSSALSRELFTAQRQPGAQINFLLTYMACIQPKHPAVRWLGASTAHGGKSLTNLANTGK
jgi:hypothetical protein